jgi:hypothetical protein
MKRSVAVFLCLSSLLNAQAPTTAHSYLLDDYRNVVFADLAAMRDRGIWEDLEASALKLLFLQMEKEAGFPLSALDRVIAVGELPRTGGMGGMPREVIVFEGNAVLGLPRSVVGGRWTEDTVAKVPVHRRSGVGEQMIARPKPELQVHGLTEDLEPVLQGQPRNGLPAPEVMSLLSGRGDNLAYFVVDVGHPVLRQSVIHRLFPNAVWSEEGGPSDMLMRLRAVGEKDDPHLEVEFVIRHKTPGDDVAVTSSAVEEWLKKAKADPQFRGLRPLWSRIQSKVDRTDVSVRLDIGRPREAVGYIALLAAPILKPRSESVAIDVEVEAGVEEPPPPPPPEPKKNGG